MFLHLSVSHSVHRGGRAWLRGACVVVGGCVIAGRHAWLRGMCVVMGGMHGCGECAWLWGVCMVVGGMHGCGGGHVWLQGSAWLWGVCMVVGGVHGCGGACVGYDEIRSMSGRYASYWNAFLLLFNMSSKEIKSQNYYCIRGKLHTLKPQYSKALCTGKT